MNANPKNLGIAAIIVGLYGLTPLFYNNLVVCVGAIVIGILLLTK